MERIGSQQFYLKRKCNLSTIVRAQKNVSSQSLKIKLILKGSGGIDHLCLVLVFFFFFNCCLFFNDDMEKTKESET